MAVRYNVERLLARGLKQAKQVSKPLSNYALILNNNVPLQPTIRKGINCVLGKFNVY